MANQAKLDVLTEVVMALLQDRETTHQRDQWAPVLKALQDRYTEEPAPEPVVRRPPCMTGGCSRPAQICSSCAAMLQSGAMHRAFDQGWGANETSSGNLEEWARQRKERNPYPSDGLQHVCGLRGFGNINDVCPACEAFSSRVREQKDS